MSIDDLKIERVHDSASAEYREFLMREIQAIGSRLNAKLTQNRGAMIPTPREVKSAHREYIESTQPYVDELTKIEMRSVRHIMVAQ